MSTACDFSVPRRPPPPIISDLDRALWITRAGDYVVLTFGDGKQRTVYAPLVAPARETRVEDLLSLLPE